jgi:hypothetical protein
LLAMNSHHLFVVSFGNLVDNLRLVLDLQCRRLAVTVLDDT